MKGSGSGEKVKKQAGKDPWGAKDRKKREAERKRAQVRKSAANAGTPGKSHAGTSPAKAVSRKGGTAKTRAPHPQPRDQRRAHAREERARPETRRRKVTLGLLMLAALAITGVVLAGPVMRNVDAAKQIDAKQAEFEREQAVTQDLESRKANANDLKFLEQEARRIGYVLPGEIPVVVVEEEVREEAPLATPPSASEEGQAEQDAAPQP